MKTLAIAALTLLLAVSCANTNDQGGYSPRSRPPMDGDGGFAGGRPMAGGLDMLPPADWWHQPMLADAVKLTSDQMTSLDKTKDQADDIARLDRDTMVAMRDIRTVLESNQPSSSDIVAAGRRLRDLRDTLFDKQVQMLAAERTILSQDQWRMLQQQLQNQRAQRRQDNGYGGRGGRGMGGGRGRRPGY